MHVAEVTFFACLLHGVRQRRLFQQSDVSGLIFLRYMSDDRSLVASSDTLAEVKDTMKVGALSEGMTTLQVLRCTLPLSCTCPLPPSRLSQRW